MEKYILKDLADIRSLKGYLTAIGNVITIQGMCINSAIAKAITTYINLTEFEDRTTELGYFMVLEGMVEMYNTLPVVLRDTVTSIRLNFIDCEFDDIESFPYINLGEHTLISGITFENCILKKLQIGAEETICNYNNKFFLSFIDTEGVLNLKNLISRTCNDTHTELFALNSDVSIVLDNSSYCVHNLLWGISQLEYYTDILDGGNVYIYRKDFKNKTRVVRNLTKEFFRIGSTTNSLICALRKEMSQNIRDGKDVSDLQSKINELRNGGAAVRETETAQFEKSLIRANLLNTERYRAIQLIINESEDVEATVRKYIGTQVNGNTIVQILNSRNSKQFAKNSEGWTTSSLHYQYFNCTLEQACVQIASPEGIFVLEREGTDASRGKLINALNKSINTYGRTNHIQANSLYQMRFTSSMINNVTDLHIREAMPELRHPQDVLIVPVGIRLNLEDPSDIARHEYISKAIGYFDSILFMDDKDAKQAFENMKLE